MQVQKSVYALRRWRLKVDKNDLNSNSEALDYYDQLAPDVIKLARGVPVVRGGERDTYIEGDSKNPDLHVASDQSTLLLLVFIASTAIVYCRVHPPTRLYRTRRRR